MREISPLSFLSTSLSSVLNEDEVVGAGGSANSNDITIEYCTGCRWMLRSAWLMQELFTTFHSADEIRSITLVPSKPPSPGGTFVIQLNNQIIWDRKQDGGFPESKVLKQIVRNVIAPTKSLGHSDSPPSTSVTSTIAKGKMEEVTTEKNVISDEDNCDECNENREGRNKGDNDKVIGTEVEAVINKSIGDSDGDSSIMIGGGTSLPNVRITYCTGCRWMLRSAWMCQELLTTFEEELHSVTLVPSALSSGIFNILIDGEMIWDRKIDGGFPEMKVLKQRVRDRIVPERNLGHIDNDDNFQKSNEEVDDDDEMGDDDAAELRNFYGVL